LGFALEKILVTHTHRLWIVDSHDKLTGVCALTDIIRQFQPPKDME
jgi:predicted transcriptional regulator